MFRTLFFIFMTFGCESETSLIKVDVGARQKLERLFHGYVNTLNQLSMQYPFHEVELQVEFNGPMPTKPPLLPFRRSNVRVVKYPKKIIRSNNNAIDSTTTTTTILPTVDTQVRQSQDSDKAPIYLDDLKKALDDFEKKLSSQSNCNGIHENIAKSNTGPVHYSSHPPAKPQRIVEDILQLIGKGVKVEYNVPKPTDDSLDWLQIKIPNNV